MVISTSIVLSVAQTLLSTLESLEHRNISYFPCYKSKLNALQQSAKTVTDILLNADGKENDANETQFNGIQVLKDAIYDVDDLVDEFVTIVESKKQMENEGRKVSQKVCSLYSRFNLITAYKMTREIKKLGEKLEFIANDHSLHKFRVVNQLSQSHKQNIIIRKDTSFVNQGIVIGREEDHEKIVSILIDSNIKRDDVSFLTIMGIGGIGKTALAQLVYNDERVINAFPLRLWTCISENDYRHLDVETILSKILATTNKDDHNGQRMPKEEVKKRLKELLTSRKYLLILDDVSPVNNHRWRDLVDILSNCCKGSWVLATTRSHETVRNIECGTIHNLKSLSKDKAWDLFKMIALGSKQLNQDDELVTIGHEIVRGCAGVPLAIRVVGSFLYGKDKNNWLSLHSIVSSMVRESEKDIIPILKLSYDKLESPLKSCFTYCALFPKNYVMKKEVLKSLWMAQGYIIPFDNEGQTIEDIAEEYFSMLLQRCFFQDVEYDETGDILSCKIHNLMHDLAQRLMEKEICVSNFVMNVDDINVRHLSCTNVLESNSLYHTHVRSFLCLDMLFADTSQFLQDLSRTWVWLRALKLLGIKNLPESMGNIIHLRYLDLSSNEELEVLPFSIIKLYNLQTLKLGGCCNLKELPNNLNKLKKLRVLDIEGCNKLNSMPTSMDKLTSLHTLSTFVVSETSVKCNQLNVLNELKNLKGKLHIKFLKNFVKVEKNAKHEDDCLKSKKHLKHIFIDFEKSYNVKEIGVLEKMQPHPALKVLEVGNHFQSSPYFIMPSWMTENNFGLHPNIIRLKLEGPWLENNLVTFLPNLIRLKLCYVKMEKSMSITCLGYLPHLKDLILNSLANLEHIFESSPMAVNNKSKTCKLLYPSLKKLELVGLHGLKGWRWRSGVIGKDNNEINIDGTNLILLNLSQLKELEIRRCPMLIAILQCPVLQSLTLRLFNKKLQVMTSIEDGENEKGIANVNSSSNITTRTSPSISYSKLKKVDVDNLAWLNAKSSFNTNNPKQKRIVIDNLSWLQIDNTVTFAIGGIEQYQQVVRLREGEEVFRSCSASLRYLSFMVCDQLKSVVHGGLEHLTNLEELRIDSSMNWNVNEGKKIEDGTPWKPPFHHCLCHLTLCNLQKMMILPKWIQFCTSLQTLKIQNCEGVNTLPKWISKLTSLKILNLWKCSDRLKERCKESTGEDWPFIQHIPSIIFDHDVFNTYSD